MHRSASLSGLILLAAKDRLLPHSASALGLRAAEHGGSSDRLHIPSNVVHYIANRLEGLLRDFVQIVHHISMRLHLNRRYVVVFHL